MRYILFIFLLLLLPVFLIAKAAQPVQTISLGLLNEPDGDRAGAEITASIKDELIGIKLSGALYGTGNIENNNQESYTGFSAFVFVHADYIINPYIGLGVFVGETENCTNEEDERTGCIEDQLMALYPEIGVEFNVFMIQVTPYIRRYFDTSISGKSGNVYGMSMGVSF